VLTKVSAYKETSPTTDPLVMNLGPEIQTDLIQIRNIDGLDPVKANITTSAFGSKQGSFLTGKNLGDRNLVFTLGLNPDWVTSNYSTLRKLVNEYFMTESQVRLVFETVEYPPVEIIGHVETNEQNPFSKDPEPQISIICPDPLFVASAPTELAQNPNTEAPINIAYEGTFAAGVKLDIVYVSGSNPTQADIYSQVGVMSVIDAPVLDSTHFLEIYSVPGSRYIKKNAAGANVFNKMYPGSVWPMLLPGDNQFYIATNNGVQRWTMEYYALYGGL
jgi:hypothetical protein